MKRGQKIKIAWAATILAVLAGAIYNSWPLGFWLNPKVSFGGGLASELEGLHQPYNWVFILLDIVTGLLVLVVVALLWQERMRTMVKVALWNFGLFGLFTIIDALLPMPCEPSVTACPAWTAQPMLILHGIASIGAAVSLFISAAIVWHLRRKHTNGLMMQGLMAAWVIFGFLSLYFFITPGPAYLSQDYYLILCGIWVGAMPAMIHGGILSTRTPALAPVRAKN